MGTHEDILQAMKRLNRHLAPGSECAQWQDYVAECYEEFDAAAWELDGDAPEGFEQYWMAVAREDYATASIFGYVPEGWADRCEDCNGFGGGCWLGGSATLQADPNGKLLCPGCLEAQRKED